MIKPHSNIHTYMFGLNSFRNSSSSTSILQAIIVWNNDRATILVTLVKSQGRQKCDTWFDSTFKSLSIKINPQPTACSQWVLIHKRCVVSFGWSRVRQRAPFATNFLHPLEIQFPMHKSLSGSRRGISSGKHVCTSFTHVPTVFRASGGCTSGGMKSLTAVIRSMDSNLTVRRCMDTT